MIISKQLKIQTKGKTDIIDITDECQGFVNESGLDQGIIVIFNPGSTGGLTTLEFEPNLIKDVKNALEVFSPSNKIYEHSKTWQDDNGVSHVRSFVIGPSITVPFVSKKLTLGTWQQIVFCDFDTRGRERKLVIQIMGE